MAVIEAQALQKRFGDVEAVQGISFAVEAGERLAYIGPNGAGKSTSIKMLTGILHPTGGTAQVLGLVPWQRAAPAGDAHRHAVRPALAAVVPAVAARDARAARPHLPPDPRAETATRIATLAELLDAADLLDRPVRTLSLGERMRCELAASVLHEPEILFLDEPTIGLDLIAQAALPRPGAAAERGALDDDLPHLARRRRHRAGGAARDRDQPRPADLRRPRLAACAASCCARG